MSRARMERIERRLDELEAKVEYLGDQAGADLMAKPVEPEPRPVPKPKRARFRVSHR